jgi:tetratricopeptide (TPR) repeat protein
VGSFLVLSSCSSKEQVAGDEGEELAARVDDWTFDMDQLQEVVDNLSDADKLKYDTPGGRAELANELIQEELYYQEGLKLGLKDDQEIKDALDKFERSLIIGRFYSDKIKPLATPSEVEMHDYYDDNLERFTRQPIARAMHILSENNPDKLRGYKKLIESGEETFTTLARKYSDDEFTQTDGGDLGYFNPGGYMRGIGYSDEISNTAFELQVGEISEPVRWKKGWSIVVLTELRPSVVRPFEEVRRDIEDIFWVTRKDKVKAAAYDELAKNYNVVNFLADQLKLTSRTPEELWNLAQNSSDSWERLRQYQEIVDRYPDSEHAAKAMFMVGFVNAEELKDFRAADRAFTRVINEFPDSEVAESAKYMLETMNRPSPQFEEEAAPDEGEAETGESNG